MNHLPGDRAFAAFSDHLLASGRGNDSSRSWTVIIQRKEHTFRTKRYFFGGAFQPLAAIILRARLHEWDK